MKLRVLAVAVGTLALIACATETDPSGSGSQNLGQAAVPVVVIHNDDNAFKQGRSDASLSAIVQSSLDLSGVREARVEEIFSQDGGSHLVVQQLVEGFHTVKVSRIDVDANDNATKVTNDYVRAEEDQVHGTTSPASAYHCPDPEVQFVTLCPNNNSEEIGYANQVGDAAEAAGLKTVRLMKSAATHDAWLNYMACPNLIGNFYDGDANTSEIVVYNGSITAREFTQSVNMGLHVTNIWLACEAYNDPMLTAVQKTAKSQKYAAGKNDLAVGPSDKAAVCAMKAAIAGKPMTAAFNDCYTQLDRPSDHWGFGGDGSDQFGQSTQPTGSTTSSGQTGSTTSTHP